VFTSSTDSGPGEWAGLEFYGDAGGGTGYLRYATVRYGRVVAQPCNICVGEVTGGEVRLESCQVLGAPDHGLRAWNGRVVISDTTFANNGDATHDAGLLAQAGSAITVTNSTFQNNAGYGVQADSNGTVLKMTGGLITANAVDGLYVPWGEVSLSITSTRIISNTGDGIDHNGSATPVMRYSQIYGNGGLGVNNRNTAVCFDATYNYWGDNDGPNDPSDADDGCMGPVSNLSAGEGVSDDVYYRLWLDENGHVPALTPSLVSSANGAVINDNAPTLTWLAGSSADTAGYLLDWNSTVMDVGNVTQYTTTVLANGTYTWTVAAYDGLGNSSPYTDVWSFCMLRADFDGDRAVTILDIQAVAARWRCRTGDLCYDPLYDMDNNGVINIVDIMKVVVDWGVVCE